MLDFFMPCNDEPYNPGLNLSLEKRDTYLIS